MEENDSQQLLRDVDAYVERLYAPKDPVLEAAIEDSRRAGLPEIHVSAAQGKLLRLLAEIAGARRILEIGTLGGYSAIHLARALPDDGTLISLELSEQYAEVARNNILRAGLDGRVEVRVGDANSLLAEMAEGGEAPFDLVFIDADKTAYLDYLEWSLRLTRPGALILADNTISGGSVLDPQNENARVVREFNQKIAEDARLSALILPIIREVVDGLTIARVVGA